jgi:PPK2 family polyphosphate:nucleotide phosphotransferase
MDHNRIIDSPRALTLDDFDPDDTGGLSKRDAEAAAPEIEEQLGALQQLLYAAHQQSVLVILQGMDTAGKDGTISHVMAPLNPVGCQVWSFKQPSEEDLSHDFLWRVHKRTPPVGMFGIFNRSHYEDVLIVRVHHLVPKDVWDKRYAQINHFEELLTANGAIILKFFLHITKDEQEQRLLAREKDPAKAWKLSVADWEERAFWQDYQAAYADAIGQCAAKRAPWFIIPANKKWYRNHLIAQTVVDYLTPYRQRWEDDLKEQGKRALAAIQAANAHEGITTKGKGKK